MKSMKLLIAYDGSPSSDSALDDLQFVGLPETGVEATIISVAEVWLPPADSNGFNEDEYPNVVKNWTRERRKIAESAVSEAETFSRHAEERVRTKFPKWQISSETKTGSPGWEILAFAEELGVDLIILGAKGRSALSRVLLGSISQKVLTEANCSVRVARGKVKVDPSPNRIQIGFDGSPGSLIAVDSVASRSWTSGSEVRLISATQSLVPTTIGRFISPVKNWVEEESNYAATWIETLAENSIRLLKNSGLSVKLEIHEGNPKTVLVDSARRWQADSIFVGAHSYTVLERFLIGSTSAAIAERAGCSVEVVRSRAKNGDS